MRTPLGIELLSIAFGVWPACWLSTILYALWKDYAEKRLADEDLNLLLIEILFCMVLIFMLSSVAIGLWKLEEGARKAALMASLVVFAVPNFAFFSAIIQDHSLPGLEGTLWFLAWSGVSGASAWYLHSRPIKAMFNRIETLGLTSN